VTGRRADRAMTHPMEAIMVTSVAEVTRMAECSTRNTIAIFGRALAVAGAAFALSACGGHAGSVPATGVAPSSRSVAVDHRISVKPGGSIQEAVDRAQSGDAVVIEPGEYHEAGRPCAFNSNQTCAVSVIKDAVSLIGNSQSAPVILDNPTGLTNGIGIGKSPACESGSAHHIEGNRVIGLTVRGFKGSGIVVSCADDWELASNNTANDILYGLYPVYAGKGRAHDNVASGATDTGIYVGLSHDVRVDHNTVYDNVSGFELENTINSVLDHNTALHNTAGILEFIIPGDPLEQSQNNIVRDNVVRDNNRPNNCSEPGDPICLVKPGTGIAVIGGSDNLAIGNQVTGNVSFGIAVADVCTGFALSQQQCNGLPFDPLPEGIQTKANTALNNGIDLQWTGNGTGNCWLANRAMTTAPTSLPQCTGSAQSGP
jgi:parallel beta-helix repeat protein